MKKIHLSKIEHRGEKRIKVAFAKSSELNQKIRKIKGRKWSQSKLCWHLPYAKSSFEALKNCFGDENLLYESKEIKEPKFLDYQSVDSQNRKVVGSKIIVNQVNDHWLEAFVPYDKKNWIETFRNIEGRKWQPEQTSWLIPNVKYAFRQMKQQVGLKNIVFNFEISADIPECFPTKSSKNKNAKKKIKLSEEQSNALNGLEDQIILKRYSIATLKSYKNHLKGLLLYYPKLSPERIGNSEIQKYLIHQIRFKKIAESTQNQIINAYKFYMEQVLKKPKEYIEIPRPKKAKQLPNVLSEDEVVELIKAPTNLKHKFILMLIYSCGLRLSEAVGLRIQDVNLGRRNIFVKAGKGKKDRYVTLANSIILYLNLYKKQYKPVYWLFEGESGGQYSKSSVQKIFRKAVEQSKVNPIATVHTLRHSYATHCVENGFSIALIQKALGHNSLRTTERYLHISNNAMRQLKSPLDSIKSKNNL